MEAGGKCPTCGRVIAEAKAGGEPRVPWHFALLLVALTIYLGVCERDNRPVRFEYPADMGPAADIPAPNARCRSTASGCTR